MAGIKVKITGLDELQRKLGADFRPAMRGATRAIAAEVQGVIAPYPKESEANKARAFGSAFSISTRKAANRWYERGYGPRWARKDGGVGGTKSSETLGRRWGIKRSGRIGAVLGNIASYAPFVHSDEKQAKFHGRRGWVTDKDAIKKVEQAGTIKRIVSDAVMHALGQR